MRYDRCDGFPFDFEPNGIPFRSKSKRKLSPRSYPKEIEYEFSQCAHNINPFMPTVAFNICCPRDAVSDSKC